MGAKSASAVPAGARLAGAVDVMARLLSLGILCGLSLALAGVLGGTALQRWWDGRQVRLGAHTIDERPTEIQTVVARGAACFRDHCVACHALPATGALADAASRWRARELLWIVREGLPKHGMPGFGGRLDEHDQWALVAFVRQLPRMSAVRWAAWQRQAHGLPCPAIGAPELPPMLLPVRPQRPMV
jgi:mono/diheme cytochrome c family protein